MAATKIINVLKNDSFDDVFDLFKGTDAEEVILIFPKGSAFSKQSQYFEALKKEADTLNKKGSIMTNDPVIARLASQFGFDLLEQSARSPKKNPPAYQPKAEESESFPQVVQKETPAPAEEPVSQPPEENMDSEIPDQSEIVPTVSAEIADENEEEAVLTAAKTPREPDLIRGRTIRDIFTVEPDHQVKIKEEKSRPVEIGIKSRWNDEKMDDIAKVWAQNRKEPDHAIVPKTSSRHQFKLDKRISSIILGGAVVIMFLIIYTALGSAKITLNPRTQKLNFTMKASASITATSANPDTNLIPGQRFTDSETVSDTFAATGQKDIVQKAGGTITIFNKSSSSQRLVATTRFKTPDGLIFRIPQTITIPAATKVGSDLQEGTISSPVYADRPGPEYNIAPSSFTIPGFEGTPKFNDFYAKSDAPMTGGITGPSKVVTEEDFSKAQDSLTAQLRGKVLKSLKDQAGDLKFIDSSAVKIGSPTTNVKVGGGADSLQMSLAGSANVIAFRESDISDLVKNYVMKNSNLELWQKGLSISYTNPQMNADNSVLTFDVQVSGQGATPINKDQILKDIPGMSENAIRAYFSGSKNIESAHIILSPFWVKSIPKDTAKIKINITQN